MEKERDVSDVLCDTAVFLDDQKVKDIVLKIEGVAGLP